MYLNNDVIYFLIKIHSLKMVLIFKTFSVNVNMTRVACDSLESELQYFKQNQ